MFRRTSFLIVSLLFFSSAGAQTPKTDREHERLKGPVKKLTVEIAELSDKSGKLSESKRELVLSCTYNSAGNLTERLDRDPSDGHINKYVVTYDKKGNRREKVYFLNATVRSGLRPPSYKWLGDENFYIARAYKHDSAGNRTEETVLQHGETLWYGDWFRYDRKGNLIETAHYNIEGWKYRWLYELDANGLIVGARKLKPDGNLILKESYEYQLDANGNWTKRITSRLVQEKGNDLPVTMEATYRTIEYY